MPPHGSPPERVLLVRNDRIGDLILTLPALAALRRGLPEAHIAVLAARYTAPLLAGNPHLDEVLVDDPAEGAAALAARLRPQQFDAALLINTSFRTAWALWRAGIACRVCWAHKPAGLLLGNRRVRLRRSHPPIHESDFALAFVARLGLATNDCKPLAQCAVDPAASQRMAQRIAHDLGSAGPLLGINPGCGHSSYNWPARHYAELTGRLARRGRVILTGSPAEMPLLQSLVHSLPLDLRRRVACYADPLPDLVATIAQQDVLVASSTGPMHLAGVLGTSVVGLFSAHPAQSPLKWAPLGTAGTILQAPLLPGQSPQVGPDDAEAHMARLSVDCVENAVCAALLERQQQSARRAV